MSKSKIDTIHEALEVLSHATRDDMVRLFKNRHWPIVIRPRDAVRDLIGLALDRISQLELPCCSWRALNPNGPHHPKCHLMQ